MWSGSQSNMAASALSLPTSKSASTSSHNSINGSNYSIPTGSQQMMPTSASVPVLPKNTTSNNGGEKRRKRKIKKNDLLRQPKTTKCGTLKKKGFFGSWKELYFSLEAGTLMEFKDSTSRKAEKAYTLQDYIVRPGANLTGVTHSLSLMNAIDNKTIFLAANTQTELREWMRALKAHCRLTKEDQSLEMTLKAINDAAVLSDESGTIISINQPAQELLGWTKEEIVGKDIKVLMTKEYSNMHDKWMENYRHTNEKRLIGKPRPVPCVRKDRSIVPCELSLGELGTADGEEKRFLGTFRSVDLLPGHDSGVIQPPSRSTSIAENLAPFASMDGFIADQGKRTGDQEGDKQLANIMKTVQNVVADELSKSNKRAQKYKTRYQRLKKKNATLNSDIVNLIGDMRLGHRSNQVSAMAFYHSISNGEASGEVDIVQHLCSMITKEINACTSPGTLFRDDCLNTQRISSFFLYQGSGYVLRTSDKFLTEFCGRGSETDNLYFELNDPAASEQDLKEREKRLLDGVHLLLNEVKNSTKDVPVSFGLLFKHLKTEISKRFLPQSLDPYSIMSSFFFLRLLIPAIVQPQRYQLLLNRPLSTGDRRGLMLISKILINMANGIVFNEGYMRVFNDTIAQNVPTLHSIFDDIMTCFERSDSTASNPDGDTLTDRTSNSEDDDVTVEEQFQAD